MPLEPQALAASLEALELWKELAALYDQVDGCLRDSEWDRVGPLAVRLNELEERLKPLTAPLAELRRATRAPDPALIAVWRETDLLVASLAERQASLVRAAGEARDATAALLIKSQGGRSQAARYRRNARIAPRFASRRV
ncbi:MAG TPA: hypothetical protein VEI94_06200 [Candidatus Bathyarchaeia archaeon]|nr:hypothetical protein [Candidatus Bathyarchaeia archaeon]